MAEEEKKDIEQEESKSEDHSEEEVDQEKLAEEWAKMAEESKQEKSEEIDQEKLAEEWAKMAEEGKEESKEEEVPQTELMEKEKLDLLMDIPLEISVEIGSTTMPLEEVLKLNPNSIVELDRYINQPVDIKVNGKLIARGELYTVDNNFGIKITSIVTVQERMKLLTDSES
ncbi:flagellar motor switch protein FliN [Persephonella atlantica]|uniref:Flagellar motor switch protein FliN n=1 Tax=Persephonella atlantica TaxID=2699429 RepID=A0ABS1GIB2_9AQUI|nr:flagellar motor switch protein FliN [Persephonella atlantica]MBK3332487.1 flagellar motor switch protein FliN [Persephonella atlantica]